MNIVFVAHVIPDRGEPLTGFPTYLYRVSRALIELGHKPIILAGGKRNDRWIDNGIEVIRIRDDCVENSRSIDYVISSFKRSYRLNQEIKKLESKMKIDIIQFTSLNGTALLYHSKIPAVVRLSSYAKIFSFKNTKHSKAYIKTMAWIDRLAAKRCNAVFAPSRLLADIFGEDIKRKVYVIETPFIDDIDVYDDKYVNGMLTNKKYVLFFGTLNERKGIKVIGQCLERFLEKNQDYYFVFVGSATVIDGENAARILRKCAGSYVDRVIILPALFYDQLYPIIQKADFVVLPSLMDNLPNACIEAMYFGKVVVGTDGASFEQLIKHGVNGFLCQLGDSEDLLAKMQMAASLDVEQKKKMERNAKKRIERLRPKVVGEQLLSFYSYVIEQTRKQR